MGNKIEEMELDYNIIAKALLKDIKLMIASEVDTRINDFLEREQSELQDLFAKVKKEDAERIESILEGVKSHTSRIKELEDFTTGLDIGGRLNKIRTDEMQVRIEKLERKVKMTNYRIEEVV